MKRLVWVAGLILLVAAGVFYYVRVDVSAAPTQLTFDAVSRGDVVATVEATGTLQPLDTVQVSTQVSGTIASIGTDFNQLVKRGQVLATLDPAIFQTQIDQAKATVIRLQSDVERAQVQYEDAALKLKRAEQLAAEQLLAQQEVDTARSTTRVAETALTGARAQLNQAQAALTQANVNLSHTVIKSPADGIVLSRAVEVGQTVSASMQAPTLFIIARDLRRLELQARVDESDIGGVKPGAPVTFTVDAYPRREFTGKVRLVQLQPQTVQNVVTYTTVIDVPNDDELLKPGMTSTVSIQIERAANTLRVPAAALRFTPTEQVLKEFPAANVEPAASEAPIDGRPRQGSGGPGRRAAVWQLVDGRLHRIPVRAGVSDGANVAITTDALDEGASIITGIARSEAVADATPAAGGSPLVPQMPRRPGSNAGGARQSQGR
ncbi:MAG TPA: efflux RND transporter periplasmic adaptor subunit [Vicinamibacterales bacterium]|nr:efflux RND transporter periplasmic adaptor subunit [Vicinamibacterales bacterium]